MGYNFDDFFTGLGNTSSGSGSSYYTLEEIEAAKKRQKKHGGTFMENLESVAPEKAAAQSARPQGRGGELPTPSLEKLDASIRELNESLARDFGRPAGQAAVRTGGSQEASAADRSGASQKDADCGQSPRPQVPTDPANILESFNGLTNTLKETILGQDDFLRKLTIAFKRPYVSLRDHNDALNSIYITGPHCTGKHYALTTLAGELKKRGILRSDRVTFMDLSLYSDAGKEKVFLQDLYAALQSDSSILVFENLQSCHISMLGHLGALVTTGECRLSERYVLQNGQLIQVANAFAGSAVGSFEAKGKYLVFLSEKPVDKLAGIMGAPFVNALGDICTTLPLSEEALTRIFQKQEAELVEKCKKQLFYDVTLDQSFRDYVLSQSGRGRGLQGILDTCQDTLRALTELRLERDDLSTSDLVLTCREGAPTIIAGEEELSLSALIPGGYNGELESVKAELDAIVGLKSVKEYIYSLEEYFGVQKRRREAGLKAGEVNKHMIFTGNPGTGKTTIARIVSKYLKAIGVLSGGQLVEVSRGDLVGRYVGHTAPLVNQVIKSAIGGVLFIDEAYSLHRGGEDSFGLEAIDTLVKGIEDNRDDLIVILAGYSDEMEEFLEANSGLKSRFPNIIDFPDYTGEELLAIGKLTAKSKGYVIDTSAEEPLLSLFNRVQATRAKDAGNGRFVRNKLEEAILNQSRRLVAEPDADMSLLLEKDFDFE